VRRLGRTCGRAGQGCLRGFSVNGNVCKGRGAANPISRSRRKGGFGAHSGPSRRDPPRRAYRPLETIATHSGTDRPRPRSRPSTSVL
jgi:hypothetical protein